MVVFTLAPRGRRLHHRERAAYGPPFSSLRVSHLIRQPPNFEPSRPRRVAWHETQNTRSSKMKAVHTLNPILERRQRWTEDEIEFSGSMSFVACSCGWYRWVKPDRDARLEGLYGATEAEDAW